MLAIKRDQGIKCDFARAMRKGGASQKVPVAQWGQSDAATPQIELRILYLVLQSLNSNNYCFKAKSETIILPQQSFLTVNAHFVNTSSIIEIPP